MDRFVTYFFRLNLIYTLITINTRTRGVKSTFDRKYLFIIVYAYNNNLAGFTRNTIIVVNDSRLSGITNSARVGCGTNYASKRTINDIRIRLVRTAPLYTVTRMNHSSSNRGKRMFTQKRIKRDNY